MSDHSLIEDHILVILARTAAKDEVSSAMYTVYRDPFCRFLESRIGREASELLPVFEKAFIDFYLALSSRRITTPLPCSLVRFLAHAGVRRLDMLGVEWPGDADKLTPKKLPMSAYLESDILLGLIKVDYQPAIRQVLDDFQEPMRAVLNSKYGFLGEDPREVHGESVALLCKVIRQEELKPPMRCKLFTYFIQIAQNVFRSVYRDRSRYQFFDDDQDLEKLQEPENPEYETNVPPLLLEKLEDSLAPFSDPSQEELLEQLLEQLNDRCQVFLFLRIYQGLSYKEIAAIQNVSEGNARRIVFNCLEQLRKQMNP